MATTKVAIAPMKVAQIPKREERFPDRRAPDSSARCRTGAHQGASLWCLPQ